MKFLYIILVIFLSAMIGTAIGEILLLLIPQSTIYYKILSNHLTPIWSINNFDLVVFNLSLAIKLNINSLTLLGLIIGSVISLKKA